MRRTATLCLTVACLLLESAGCHTHAETRSPQPAAPAPVAHWDEIVAHLQGCQEDPACKAHLDEPLLQGCPWYESVYCSAAVAAAGAACVVTEGEACLPAIEIVKSMGCCDCLPSGPLKDMCNAIP